LTSANTRAARKITGTEKRAGDDWQPAVDTAGAAAAFALHLLINAADFVSSAGRMSQVPDVPW